MTKNKKNSPENREKGKKSMGRYNFSAEKIRQLETENAEFKAMIAKLSNTVGKLEKALEIKENGTEQEEKTVERYISKDIDKEKLSELFGIDVQGNKIVRSDNQSIISNYCQTLFQGIIRFISPKVRESARSKKITCKSLCEMSEDEYLIATETFKVIVETLFYAKKKIEGLKND